jgi:hypothetical protein
MCCNVPMSSTEGPMPPKMTLWEAIVILWREAVTRPDREGK